MVKYVSLKTLGRWTLLRIWFLDTEVVMTLEEQKYLREGFQFL